MGVGSSNSSITRSNYSMNNLIAGGTSTVQREQERDKIHNEKEEEALLQKEDDKVEIKLQLEKHIKEIQIFQIK